MGGRRFLRHSTSGNAERDGLCGRVLYHCFVHQEDSEAWAELGRASIDGIVIVEPQGRVKLVNDAAAGMLRAATRSLVGVELGTFLTPSLDVILARPTGARIDGTLRLANGGELPVHVWARDGGSSVSLVLRDASEWEVARSTLTVVAAGVEHALDGFEITDADGNIEYANAAHATLTGYSLFEAIGERITRYIDDPGPRVAVEQALAAGVSWRGETSCVRKDGAVRFHDLAITPVLDGRAHLQRWVCIRRDVTDRVEVEREAEMLRAQLAHAERTSIVGRLAASVAHEVNNPATSILANLEMAREEVDQLAREIEIERVTASGPALAALDAWWAKIRMDERLAAMRDALGDSWDGTERVVRLVRELRGLARVATAQVEVISLNDVVRAAVRVARCYAQDRAELSLELGVVPDVAADPTQIGQVVMNLVASATSSITPGNPGDNHVVLKTFRHGDDVVLTVEDTGTGIAPEHLPHVFDPFYSLRSFGEGPGLVLAVARDILERAGGDIRVESRASSPGQPSSPGTRYVVRLPAAPAVVDEPSR